MKSAAGTAVISDPLQVAKKTTTRLRPTSLNEFAVRATSRLQQYKSQ